MSPPLLLCIVLLMLPGMASADGWDDFANNLATDLAPLLALFGEQVTKQYLSESLNWVDNFIFAMAPLGIITAVVSVIRVCGGSSLRAFVGRAQEGRGVAEAELCSSTSSDVCELWNNGGIARVFGQPQILEVVFDPETGIHGHFDKYNMPTEGIFLPKDYFGTSLSSGKRFAAENKRWLEQDAGSHDAEISPGMFAPKPNLSLNIGITKPATGVFVVGAVLGFMLQASVLVFAGWATFIGDLKKDGETMRPWAFPLTCIGASLLGSGMFLCALLIERSTGERIFRWKGERGKAPKRYFIQAANQTVGDQTFEAFAHGDRLEHYITSWKVQDQKLRSIMGIPEPIVVWVTIGGTLIGFILQFVGLRAMHSSVAMFQFGITIVMAVVRAGLRTRRLDDSANSLRGLRDRLQGHELDWLAIKIEQDRVKDRAALEDQADDEGSWEIIGPAWLTSRGIDVSLEEADSNSGTDEARASCIFSSEDGAKEADCVEVIDPNLKVNEPAEACKSETERFSIITQRRLTSSDEAEIIAEKAELANIVTAMNSPVVTSENQETQISIADTGTSYMREEAKADHILHGAKLTTSGKTKDCIFKQHTPSKILKYRARLARITASDTLEDSWQADIRTQAVELKKAVEETAMFLFSGEHATTVSLDDDARLLWPIRARFQINKKTKIVESIYLGMNKVHKRWETELSDLEATLSLWMWSLESDDFSGTLRDASKIQGISSCDRIFAVGSSQESEIALHDLQLWVRSKTSPVVGRLERFSTSAALQADRKRYFGWQTVGFDILSSATPESILSIPTSNSILRMCAQDVYSSFLDFALASLADIGRGTSIRMSPEAPSDDTTDPSFGLIQLSNPVANKIASIFEGNGLGSIEDADLCIFSCLRKHSKLPSSHIAYEKARQEAISLRLSGNWQQAETLLKWIFERCVAGEIAEDETRLPENRHKIGIYKAARDLAELWRNAMRDSHKWEQMGYDGVLWLLTNKVDPIAQSLKNTYGWLAWNIACENKDEERKRVLREVGADTITMLGNSRIGFLSITTLLEATRYSHRAKALLFLKRGKTVHELDEYGRSTLIWATINGWQDIVRSLLELGANPNCRDRRNRDALSYAAEKGNLNILRLLLDVIGESDGEDQFGRTPLSYAAEHGHSAAVKIFFSQNHVSARGQDQEGKTILHRAAESGNGDLVISLLALGLNSQVKLQSSTRMTALHLAVLVNAWGVTSLLLANDADPEARTAGGQTPLHLAAKDHSSSTMNQLLQNFASVKGRDSNGWTALHIAAAMGCYNNLKILTENDADITAIDEEGYTPVHWAVARSQTSNAIWLIGKGADPEAVSGDGSKPLDVAINNGQRILADYLLGITKNDRSVWEGGKWDTQKDRSTFAMTCIGRHQWLYFQTADGNIRRAWTNPLDPNEWLGGEQNDVICAGTLFGPIAATSWMSNKGLNHRIYYLDDNGYLQEMACLDERYEQHNPDWECEPSWTQGDIVTFGFRAALHSQLAVTAWGNGNIRLCYQDSKQVVCELCGLCDSRGTDMWKKGSEIHNAIGGTSLALVTFNDSGTRREFRLYYQGIDRKIREQIWNDAELFVSTAVGIEILPGASIAANQSTKNSTRVFSPSPSGTFRNSLYTISHSWTTVQTERISKPLGTQFAITQHRSDIRLLFFTKDGCLNEMRKMENEWEPKLVFYCEDFLQRSAQNSG